MKTQHWQRCLILVGVALAVAAQARAGSSYKVGSFGKTMDTNVPVVQQVTHGLGETPKVLILWTPRGTTTNLNFGMGFSDGTTSRSTSMASADNANTAETSSVLSSKVLTIQDSDGTALAEADLVSWDNTTFTISWTANHGSTYAIHYIVIGGTDISAKVVEWTMPASTGNISVTGVGFEPDVVINSFARLSTAAAHGIFGLGVMDADGGQWANSVYSVSGVGDMDTQRGQSTSACIHAANNDLTVFREASWVSMDTDGFTVNFGTTPATTNNALSLALKGLKAKPGSLTKSTNTTTPVTQPIAGVGFEPSLILVSSFLDPAQANPVPDTRYGVGASDGTTEGASAFRDPDGLGKSDTSTGDRTSKVFLKSNVNTGVTEAEADLTSLDGDGFTLSWTSNDTVATEILYLALAPQSLLRSVAGTIFEDVNYGGGTGRNLSIALADAPSFAVRRPNVVVELYDSLGTFVDSTTTAADGSYSFSSLTAAKYTIRVVNGTVTSSRVGSDGSEITVQTFRADSLGETAGTGANKVGGERPIDIDAPANNGSQTLADLQSPAGQFTQSIATVNLSGTNATGLDFGFNFDTIVNTNDTAQGALRQFIVNANLLTDNDSLSQDGRTAGRETSIFMIPSDSDPLGRTKDPNFNAGRGVAVIAPATELPALTDAGTAIDGATQTDSIGDTNAGILGYIGTVGLGPDGQPTTGDEPTLSGVAAPEIEILGSSAISNGMTLSADDLVVRGISVYGFGSGGLDANILIGSKTLDLNNTGCVVEQSVLGTSADSFTDPGAPSRSAFVNMQIRTADSSFVHNNLFGFVGREHIRAGSGALGWQINDNEFRAGGLASAFGGITLIADATADLHRNIVADDAASAGILAVNAVILAEDNTITGNAGSGIAFWQNAGSMQGTGQILRNDIAGNDGPGVTIYGENGTAPTTTQVLISKNRFSANTGNAIDLAPGWSGDGITPNDGTLLGDGSAGNVPGVVDTVGNKGLDFPIIDSALLSGTTTVTGRACPTCSVEVYQAVADGNGFDTLGGADYGEGISYLGTAAADSITGAFTLAGIPGLNPGDFVSAVAIDSTDNTSEFGTNVEIPPATTDLSGTIFNDALINGATGEPFNSGEGDAGIVGARVELFDATGGFIEFTTTGGSGDYAFSNLDNDTTYTIRVVASTLDAGVGALPEQTFESDGTTDFGTFGTAMGGQDPLAADTTALATFTGAEHRVSVSVGAPDVTGVDFGFSYELIVNTNDTAQGSLRRFIENANAIAGIQASRFNIPASDPNYLASPLSYTIQPDSSLPEVIDPVVIDGTTQPDFVATPIVVLEGSGAGVSVDGLKISAGSSTVRGFVIEQFTLNGIHVVTTGGNTIEGSYIGIDVTGLLDRGNGANGIHIDSDTGSNVIGGTSLAARNVISGNGANGIFLQTSSTNVIQGNYIGADKNGAPTLGNSEHGVRIDGGDNTTVGGTIPSESNLITGNQGSGVAVSG